MDKILLADYNLQNLTLAKNYIIRAGYEVESADTGKNALKKARIFHPALLILELSMPDISGFDITKMIKSNPDTKDILVLMITSSDSKEYRKRAYENGADDFLAKPFDMDTFLSRVTGLLRIKKLADNLENQYAKLKEKNDLYDMQITMARQIQQAMVEEYHIKADTLHIYSKYLPAMDIGGDMYDIYQSNNSNTYIFICDVSGHGISAALLTSMMKTMFRSIVEKEPRPSQLLYEMNERFNSIFTKNEIGVYACAFCACFSLLKKECSFSNAGHVYPLYLNSAKDTVQELNLGGIPLGLMENTQYEERCLTYAKEDLFFFYTDGLCDSYYKNAPDEFLRLIKKLLWDMRKGFDAQEILAEIKNSFYHEANSQESDDVSMIVCQIQ